MRSKRLLKAFEISLTDWSLREELVGDDITSKILVREELTEIITEFVGDIYKRGGIQEIERKVNVSRNIDLDSLQKALGLFSDVSLEDLNIDQSDGKKFVVQPTKLLDEIRGAIDTIAQSKNKLGRLEVALRVEMFLDAAFNNLMMTFHPEDQIFAKMTALVYEKMKVLQNDEILLLWARIKAQFNEGQFTSGFQKYDDIIPSGYWAETQSLEELQEGYALFVSKYRPLTVRRMFSEGYSSYPVGIPGIAKILSLKDYKKIEAVSNLEVLIVRSLSRIVALFTKLTFESAKNLAIAIGADPNGFVFDGEFFQHDTKSIESKKRTDYLMLLISNMKMAVEYVEELTVNYSEVSEALWLYKLGQEIIAPSRNSFILKDRSGEITLQKDLSKFLIERGILSFGRTFGRNQIDLYSKDRMGEDFVIEAKLYKRNPKGKDIQKNLVQLMSYMDQIKQPRGVLAIFNCSNTLIISPRKWIDGRIWILAINICEASPSGRSQFLEINESSTKDNFVGYSETKNNSKELGQIPKKKSRRI